MKGQTRLVRSPELPWEYSFCVSKKMLLYVYLALDRFVEKDIDISKDVDRVERENWSKQN